MRSANSYEIYENEGKFAAIKFGSGHASEQEHGVERLLEKFGVDEDLIATEVPDVVSFFKTDDGKTVLTAGEGASKDRIPLDLRSFIEDDREHTKLAWSEHSFGIITSDAENAKRLEELYVAIQNKDVAFYYERAELYVGINSRTQEFDLDERWNIAETRDILDREPIKISQEKRDLQKSFEEKFDKELEKAINESKNKMEKSYKKMQENMDEPKLKNSFEKVYNNEKENYEFQTGNLNHNLTIERKKNQYHHFLKTQSDETIQNLNETYADLLINSVIDKNAEKETYFDYIKDKLEANPVHDNAKEL